MARLVGAIDAGGTAFKCGIFNPDRQEVGFRSVRTTDPVETLGQCLQFFEEHQQAGRSISSLGIACFGPLNLDEESADFGEIFATPKKLWNNVNLKTWFEDKLSLGVSIETDVNAALLAERAWGAAQNTKTSIYITVGTGIGAGIYANGNLIGKPSHPEFGHMTVQQHEQDNEFRGICPYHSNCLEGLSSANAVWKRFGDPEKLDKDHLAWIIVADYLAQACQTLILTFRPDKILLGGGLMQAPHIITQIQNSVIERMNSYAGITEDVIRLTIARPKLGDKAGLLGGLYMALC